MWTVGWDHLHVGEEDEGLIGTFATWTHGFRTKRGSRKSKAVGKNKFVLIIGSDPTFTSIAPGEQLRKVKLLQRQWRPGVRESHTSQ